MLYHTQDSLFSELAALRTRIPPLAECVNARRDFELLQHQLESDLNHSAVYWMHCAHAGTLERLSGWTHLPSDASSITILAIARSLFENLVWLKLMRADVGFGLVFYGQLLLGQQEHINRYLRKLNDEAELFDVAQGIDQNAIPFARAEANKVSGQQVQQEAFRTALDSHRDDLDDMIRREFSLYANQAVINGYGTQAGMVRGNVIPIFEDKLSDIMQASEIFRDALPKLLPERLEKLSTTKWNWADRAKEAGMEKHYHFLYSYTSRLLHSTPLSIITENSLASSEIEVLLNYMVLAASDAIEIIENVA